MIFANDDDENDFAAQPGSSKLANLFSGQSSSVSESKSFTYTAPKQPSKNPEGSPAMASSMSLLHATAIHAFKFEGGKPTSQGKLGIAILGHHESCIYKLVLYRGKQQHVSVATVTPSFIFAVQPNYYANFYDDKRENWSVKFDNDQTAVEFSKQVALAKANSAGSSLNTVVIQDLAAGEGTGLEVGNSVEIKYTGWLLTNNSIGKVFDSNINSDKFLKVRLGRGKVIKGWEDGLLGAKKNCKRLIIVPPSLGYGQQGYGSQVPPNSTLVFEVLISKVKSGRESSSSSASVASEGDSKNLSQNATDDSVRARGASLSEQLSAQSGLSAESEKAKIISRMARMGMPMLPLQGAVPAQPSSDSDTEDDVLSRKSSTPPLPSISSQIHHDMPGSPKPSPRRKPAPASHASHPANPVISQHVQSSYPGMPQHQTVGASAQQVALFQSQPQYGGTIPFAYQPIQPMMVPQPPYSSAPIQPGSVVASVADSHMPLLLSETRSQGTEVRLSLGKISDKVDMVLSKLEANKSQPTNFAASSAVGAYMDSEVLLHNIQRIVQENIKLKQENEEKTSKINTLNEKIYDLLQRNQKFFEESTSMLQQRSDSMQNSTVQSQAHLLSLEKEKLKLATELQQASAQLTVLQTDLESKQKQDSDLQIQLNQAIADSQKYLSEVEGLKLQAQEKEELVSSLQTNLKEARSQKLELESRLQNSEEQISELKHLKNSLEKSLQEKKQKVVDERKKADEELEELKVTHEKEIEELRNRYLKQRSGPSPEQIAEIEEDIKKEWQKKCDSMVEEKNSFQREIQFLQKEKQELEQKLQRLQEDIDRLQSKQDGSKEVEELQKEIASLKQWQVKYEQLNTSALALKKKYEDRMKELMAENTTIRSMKAISVSSKGVDFEGELKKIMNSLFQELQGEFEEGETYTRKEIIPVIVSVIRDITQQVLQEKHQKLVPTLDETDADQKGSFSPVKNEDNAEETIPMTIEESNNVLPINPDSKPEETDEPDSNQNHSYSIKGGGDEQQNETNSNKDKEEKPTENSVEVTEKREFQESSEIVSTDAESTKGLEKSQVKEEEEKSSDRKPDESAGESVTSTTNAPQDSEAPAGESVTSTTNAPQDSKAPAKTDAAKSTQDWSWKPQPPPPPLFDDDDEDDDDWLK